VIALGWFTALPTISRMTSLYSCASLQAFYFEDDSVIGYDTTIHHRNNSEIIVTMVAGEEYSVVEKIFSSEMLRGHTTQWWHVRKDVKDDVLKDSWIHNGCMASKIETLKLIFSVAGVPKLIVSEEVKLPNGKVDSTNLH
jgi:hypothetical protein